MKVNGGQILQTEWMFQVFLIQIAYFSQSKCTCVGWYIIPRKEDFFAILDSEEKALGMLRRV